MHKRNQTGRRLIRAAAFALVRGAAGALGAAAISGFIWWIQSH